MEHLVEITEDVFNAILLRFDYTEEVEKFETYQQGTYRLEDGTVLVQSFCFLSCVTHSFIQDINA